MKRNGIIVDTSVWIEYFTSFSKISHSVRELLKKIKVAGTGIVLAELLQGIKTPDEEQIILDIFDSIPFIETTKDIWLKAGQLAFNLRRKGIIIPLSDVVMATIAIENKLSIFTIDKHFEKIPGLSLYKV